MLSQTTIDLLEEFCRVSNSYWDQGGARYWIIDSFEIKEPASKAEVSAFFNKAIGEFECDSGLNNYQVALSDVSEATCYEGQPIYYSVDDDDCFSTMVLKFKLKNGGCTFVEIFWSVD
ncbi:hypothetical protein [uncultured Pseudoteredinibacter sp.]|uniref:hypothetical protein n=1 Tax=uncultured Pseudoteredinibacter sp. TaxID=1641701 RepID=UPI002604306A|nr:hypothetical protein [uncultured Pseudoteredinibacter sp.]